MQSTQESVLEEFMQRSFGAQFLFVPKKYKKGTAHREPADLAWVTDELVVLFYLRSSSESLESQIKHNRNQAAGYHRMWASGKPAYALRGKNRFGDECFVPYEKAPMKAAMLIVSSKCGPHFSEPLTPNKPNVVLVLPELLVHWVAEFGGTIVDLMLLINSYLDRFGDFPPSSSEAFEAMLLLTQKYVDESLSKADPTRSYLSGGALQDYHFIFEHLSHMKLSADSGRAVADRQGREDITGLFGDFMFGEFAAIAAGAEKAIRASEPPTFKRWAVLKLIDYHYNFVIGTVHIGSGDVMEATNAALDACKAEPGQPGGIYILYGNLQGINEYRAPLLFGIPQVLPRKHATMLMEQLLDRATKQNAT